MTLNTACVRHQRSGWWEPAEDMRLPNAGDLGQHFVPAYLPCPASFSCLGMLEACRRTFLTTTGVVLASHGFLGLIWPLATSPLLRAALQNSAVLNAQRSFTSDQTGVMSVPCRAATGTLGGHVAGAKAQKNPAVSMISAPASMPREDGHGSRPAV